jgi:hypothetical protein
MSPSEKRSVMLTPQACSNKVDGGCKINMDCSDCLFLKTINNICRLKNENMKLKGELAFYKKQGQLLKKQLSDALAKT